MVVRRLGRVLLYAVSGGATSKHRDDEEQEAQVGANLPGNGDVSIIACKYVKSS